MIFLIPKISVCGKIAAADAVNDGSRLQFCLRLLYQLDCLDRNGFKVWRNEIAARQRGALQSHQSGSMSMGKSNNQLFARDVGSLADCIKQVVHFLPSHHTMIEGDDELLLATLQRCEEHDGRPERSVNAGGSIMFCRTPHAMIDVRWRCNVAMRQGKSATALRGVNVHRCYFSGGIARKLCQRS